MRGLARARARWECPVHASTGARCHKAGVCDCDLGAAPRGKQLTRCQTEKSVAACLQAVWEYGVKVLFK